MTHVLNEIIWKVLFQQVNFNHWNLALTCICSTMKTMIHNMTNLGLYLYQLAWTIVAKSTPNLVHFVFKADDWAQCDREGGFPPRTEISITDMLTHMPKLKTYEMQFAIGQITAICGRLHVINRLSIPFDIKCYNKPQVIEGCFKTKQSRI